MQFSNQLTEMLDAVKRIEGLNRAAKSPDGSLVRPSEGEGEDAVYSVADTELLSCLGVLDPSMAAEIAKLLSLELPRSLQELSTINSPTLLKASQFGAQLCAVLWDKEWKLDDSMRDVSNVNLEDFVQTATRGLEFEAFRAREAAITNAILRTYSWVYDRHPPTGSKGVLKWSSFPD